MDIIHIVVLALVQGITEFLPISSSAHLVLVPVVFGWPDQGLLIDVAVHVGTLGAVVAYFWRDVGTMFVGALHLVSGRIDAPARLVLLLVVATIPVVVAGLVLDHFVPDGIRSITLIGWTTLVFGVALYVADRFGDLRRAIAAMGFSDAVVIGLSQILALVPGTSRSGITMTAARMLGFDRTAAARFSLLLSIPTILGAGLLEGVKLAQRGDQALTQAALVAAALAFVSALVAIALMMVWLRRATFAPFVVYRIGLGIILLVVSYA